jgi:amino acid transporter
MAAAAEGVFPKGDYQSDKSAPHSSSDVEKQNAAPTEGLKRNLSSRHLQFVAIGGKKNLVPSPHVKQPLT